MRYGFNAAVAAMLVAGFAAIGHAQDQSTTRITTPEGVTITYPSAVSGMPHEQAADGPMGPKQDGNPTGLGIFAIAAPPPSAALPSPTQLGPTSNIQPLNLGAVQAFAAGAPNAGVDSAPTPAPRGSFVPNWSSAAPLAAGCPWTQKRRC